MTSKNRTYHYNIYSISCAIESICGDKFIGRRQDSFIHIE